MPPKICPSRWRRRIRTDAVAPGHGRPRCQERNTVWLRAGNDIACWDVQASIELGDGDADEQTEEADDFITMKYAVFP